MGAWLALAAVFVGAEAADFVHGGTKRILFGSCNKQHAPQPLWAVMTRAEAEAFFWTGDAVYPNRSDAAALEVALGLQRERPEYRRFLETVSVVDGTWDDHDLGVNDAGKELRDSERRLRAYVDFLAKESAQKSFYEERSALALERGGAYSSHIFVFSLQGGENIKAKVILLDTRSFRDSYLVPSVGAKFRGAFIVGRLMPLLAAAVRLSTMWLADFIGYRGDVLGERQWQWFEDELQEPSNYTIVVSSIQFATSNPSFESWGHFPRAKRRFLGVLRRTEPRGFLLVSGDVHHAEAAQIKGAASFREVTSSGLTHTLATSKVTRLLFPPLLAFFSKHRPPLEEHQPLKNYATELNYGQIDFKTHTMVVTVRGLDGEPLIPAVVVDPTPYEANNVDDDECSSSFFSKGASAWSSLIWWRS